MATITRGSDIMSDRYRYDFRLCTYANGWAQLDTKQDAPYYGNWVNPTERKLFSYCEGDTTLTECADDADFIASVRECCEWQKGAGYFIGIDADGAMRSRFESLGLGEYLHKPAQISCGCCTGGCVCFMHRDVPNGRPEQRCSHHSGTGKAEITHLIR